MLLKLYVFVALIYYFGCADKIDETDDANLYNHAIEMKHVIASVEYKDQQINVWKDKSQNRFYAFPICVVEMNTMRCEENIFLDPSRHALLFTVRLWDDEIREVVHSAISNYGNTTVEKEDVQILPMQEVRLQARGGNIKVDPEWRSFQNQPSDIEFEIFVKDAKFCQVMLNESLNSPQTFFTQTQLEFQFTMVAQQQSTREINITSETLAKSELYTRLKNFYEKLNNDSADIGSVILDSDDIKKLARELYNAASASEEVSADYRGSKEEDKLINKMIEKLYEEKVDAKKVFEEDTASVFWDKKFATPDKISRLLSNVFKYDKKENLFHYDEQKAKEFRGDLFNQETDSQEGSGSVGGGGSFLDILSIDSKWEGGGSKNETSTNHNKTDISDEKAFSTDVISNGLEKSGVNVEIEGEKFVPKSLDLYRVNLNDFKNKNEVFFDKMIVTSVESTSEIQLKPDMDTLTLFPDKKPYEYDLKNLAASPSKLVTIMTYQGQNVEIYTDDVAVYGTPLSLIEMESMKCRYNRFTGRQVLSFNVILWDEKIEKTNLSSLSPYGDKIKMFPLIEVRLGARMLEDFEVNPQWIPHDNQNYKMTFEVFVKNHEICESYIEWAEEDFNDFLRETELELQYPVISKKEVKTELIVTNKILEKHFTAQKAVNNSIFFVFDALNNISNSFLNAVLQSHGINIVTDVRDEEKMECANQIRNKLHVANMSYYNLTEVQRRALITSDAAPINQSSWFNDIFQYNKTVGKFYVNIGNANQLKQESKNVFDISFDTAMNQLTFESHPHNFKTVFKNLTSHYITKIDMMKLTDSGCVYVKWNGEEFVPKPVTVYEINIKNLKEIPFTCAVLSNIKTIQKIPLLSYLNN